MTILHSVYPKACTAVAIVGHKYGLSTTLNRTAQTCFVTQYAGFIKAFVILKKMPYGFTVHAQL